MGSGGRRRHCLLSLRHTRRSPCSLCFKSSNTEHTERLSDLCVETVLTTENTDALLGGRQIVGGADIALYVCARQVWPELLQGADMKIDVGATRIDF